MLAEGANELQPEPTMRHEGHAVARSAAKEKAATVA